MNKLIKIVAIVSTLTLVQASVYAEEGRHVESHIEHIGGPGIENHDNHRAEDNSRHEGWHGDIHRFHDHDLEVWRTGHWSHDRHLGINAWWWVVGGVWYVYSSPVYPYPDPFLPPDIEVMQTPPNVVAPVQPMQTTQYWYYCAKPAGYYPYVPQCQVGWQKVAATNPPNVP